MRDDVVLDWGVSKAMGRAFPLPWRRLVGVDVGEAQGQRVGLPGGSSLPKANPTRAQRPISRSRLVSAREARSDTSDLPRSGIQRKYFVEGFPD